MVVSSTDIMEWQDPQKPRRCWRFYTGDIETLVSHLTSLRFGSEAGGLMAVRNVQLSIRARRDEALASGAKFGVFRDLRRSAISLGSRQRGRPRSIKLDSRDQILSRQKRYGFNNKRIAICKPARCEKADGTRSILRGRCQ